MTQSLRLLPCPDDLWDIPAQILIPINPLFPALRSGPTAGSGAYPKSEFLAAGVRSPLSLYNEDVATMEADPTHAYNQDDATGFIRLNALRPKADARRNADS